MSVTSTLPRRSRRKDARPGELLDAAFELFVEHGYAATRVEAVAQRAGVSKGTLFLYFPSKEELFKAVVRHRLSSLFVNWNAEFEAFEGSSAEMVRYAVHQWWQHVGGTAASGIAKLVMTEAHQFPEIADFYQNEVIEPGNALLRRILSRGMERGEFRRVNLDYGIYGLIAPMTMLLLWKHGMSPCCRPGFVLDPHAFLEAQTEMLLNGLSQPLTTARTAARQTGSVK